MAAIFNVPGAPRIGGFVGPVIRTPSTPIASPAPRVPPTYSAPTFPATGASTGIPLRSVGPAYSGSTGTSSPALSTSLAPSFSSGMSGDSGSLAGADMSSGSMSAPSSSFLSGMPWWAWLAIVLAGVYLLAQPRELSIKS